MTYVDWQILREIDERQLLEHAVSAKQDVLLTEFGLQRVPSYGLEPAGYTLRVGGLALTCRSTQIRDPREENSLLFDPLMVHYDPDTGLEYFLLEPGQTALFHSIEVFNMPYNLMANATGKSSYARLDVNVYITTIEPGWKGQLVMEAKNQNQYGAVKIWKGAGLAQVHFQLIDSPHSRYEEKGKYQNQEGVRIN